MKPELVLSQDDESILDDVWADVKTTDDKKKKKKKKKS